ncbi:FAD-binding oxidoreductase [Leifsonia sp. 2TAF2]|uniref:FAD-binding oxidoreductase n=1 Tax=Leifsonia sp. 2TAF2 TaxID=3233009 RepID=UPI003F99D9B7
MLDIIRPGDDRYELVRHVYSATGSPAAVVRPRVAAEVPEALAFARREGGPFSVRSGGHGISSISTNQGGTVIDLGALTTIERIDDRVVEVGPGARWGGVASALRPWGLAISSGDSGDVGVGGLATTGGIGLMGRAHGLTIDALVGAEIVTADGTVRWLSASEDPDLFWAVRGAGANFGIVTRFRFRASTDASVIHASFAYSIADTAGFLERWGATVESAPREISAFLYLFGGEPTFAQATVVFAGTDTETAVRALEPFTRLAQVVGQRAQSTPYADILPASGAVHSGAQTAVTRTGLADHLDSRLSSRLASLARGGGADMIQLRSVGGAINDVPVSATAYAHRHQNFSVTAVSTGGVRRLDAAWTESRELIDGLYLSFESDHAPERVQDAFPPETLARLRTLKARWDPDGIFDQNFALDARHRSFG